MQTLGFLVQDVGDRSKLLLALVVRHLQHGSLCPFDEVARRCLPSEHAGLDFVRARQQRPHLRVFPDYSSVLARVPRGRDPAGQLVDRVRTADVVQLPVLAERLGNREVVDLVVGLEQLLHRREHGSVLLAVEVLWTQLLLD